MILVLHGLWTNSWKGVGKEEEGGICFSQLKVNNSTQQFGKIHHFKETAGGKVSITRKKILKIGQN